MTTSFGSTSNGLSPTRTALAPLGGRRGGLGPLEMRGLTLTITLHGTFIGLESLYTAP